jgi:hypothetical protein
VRRLLPLLALAVSACAYDSTSPKLDGAAPGTPSSGAARKLYQPLAKGDSWTYTCNHQFKIEDRVVGAYRVGKQPVFALSLQIPSSPSKSITIVQLLANDAQGNAWIYGYLIGGKVRAVKRAEIVAQSPVKGKHYDYPGVKGGTVSRIFKLFEYTNRTPLGVFWVAAYFESNDAHNYGYSLGRGVMEQDHGPNYRYDCLIEKYVVH